MAGNPAGSCHGVQQQVKKKKIKNVAPFFLKPPNCVFSAGQALASPSLSRTNSDFIKALVSLTMPQGSSVRRFFLFWASAKTKVLQGFPTLNYRGGIARTFSRKTRIYKSARWTLRTGSCISYLCFLLLSFPCPSICLSLCCCVWQRGFRSTFSACTFLR